MRRPPRELSNQELAGLVAEAAKLLESMVARDVPREIAMRALILAAVAGGAVGRPLDDPDTLRARLLELISPEAVKLMHEAAASLLPPPGRC